MAHSFESLFNQELPLLLSFIFNATPHHPYGALYISLFLLLNKVKFGIIKLYSYFYE